MQDKARHFTSCCIPTLFGCDCVRRCLCIYNTVPRAQLLYARYTHINVIMPASSIIGEQSEMVEARILHADQWQTTNVSVNSVFCPHTAAYIQQKHYIPYLNLNYPPLHCSISSPSLSYCCHRRQRRFFSLSLFFSISRLHSKHKLQCLFPFCYTYAVCLCMYCVWVNQHFPFN